MAAAAAAANAALSPEAVDISDDATAEKGMSNIAYAIGCWVN
jgi:hypothetical protein